MFYSLLATNLKLNLEVDVACNGRMGGDGRERKKERKVERSRKGGWVGTKER